MGCSCGNTTMNEYQWIFWANLVNIMTADALAPCVARSSAAMVLAIYNNKQVCVFEEEAFQLYVPSQVLGRDRKHDYILMLPEVNLA